MNFKPAYLLRLRNRREWMKCPGVQRITIGITRKKVPCVTIHIDSEENARKFPIRTGTIVNGVYVRLMKC